MPKVKPCLKGSMVVLYEKLHGGSYQLSYLITAPKIYGKSLVFIFY